MRSKSLATPTALLLIQLTSGALTSFSAATPTLARDATFEDLQQMGWEKDAYEKARANPTIDDLNHQIDVLRNRVERLENKEKR